MSETEYAGVVLEDQLLDHLATPEGATMVWRERLHPEVIAEEDQGIRDALSFVIEYMDRYREPPDVSVLMEETGYDAFEEPIAPIEYVIERLRERYQRQQLKRTITKMARLSKEPHEALSYGLDELTRIKLETASVGSSLSSNDLLGALDTYRKQIENKEQGVTFGYHLMDKHLGGLSVGELTVILARPKRYKSWQLLKSACDAVLGDEERGVDPVSVEFVTMELSEAEMLDRFTCMVAGVSWYKFKHKLLGPDDVRRIEEVAQELMEWPYKLRFHRPKPGDRNVQHIVSRALDNEASAMYIDQLSWFDDAKDTEKNWLKIGRIMEQLKDATQHFPIFMAAQYNRAQAAEEGIGDLANIGLADAIGQTADTLLGIYASRDMLENKLIHLGIVDARSYEPITWEIKVELTERANFKMIGVKSD